jgi:hypothetical protein
MEDIKKIYEYHFTYNKPIPFKNLLIYPILMSEHFEFYGTIKCLTIEQNKIPDPKILSMSYLDFLFHSIKTNPDYCDYREMLVEIIRICLRVEPNNIGFTDENGKITLFINGEKINKKDFDILRKIICYQNMPDYDDTYIDPELKQALDEANELNSREFEGQTSLERQILCVVASTALKQEDIEKMTIRKFILLLQIVDSKLHYQIYKTGECSGMSSFKKPILHWMYYKDNKFDSLIKYDSFKEKMKHAT